MNKTYYFPHDYHASEDDKLEAVRFSMKCEGIGIYWCIVERLYANGGYLPIKNINRYAKVLNTKPKKIEQLLKEFGLFEIKGEMFYSPEVLIRLNHINDKCNKAKENIEKRWNGSNTDVIPPNYEGNTSKVKKSKVNKNKVNKKNVTVPTEEALKLAHLFKRLVLENNPKALIEQYSFDSWVLIIDEMLTLEKRPSQDIQDLMLWCERNDYWKLQINCMQAFRDKYDKLMLQSQAKPVDLRLKNKVIVRKYHVDGDPESPPLEVKEPVEQPKEDEEKRSKCQF